MNSSFHHLHVKVPASVWTSSTDCRAEEMNELRLVASQSSRRARSRRTLPSPVSIQSLFPLEPVTVAEIVVRLDASIAVKPRRRLRRPLAAHSDHLPRRRYRSTFSAAEPTRAAGNPVPHHFLSRFRSQLAHGGLPRSDKMARSARRPVSGEMLLSWHELRRASRRQPWSPSHCHLHERSPARRR